ncbi:hypothetical protein [Ectobacillus ponti]|uniref:Uncharacterized protein n=1 Tax=Ectobacillus ponti TaxID=2961894 RepID=A0AA41XDE3_9BACI|nr:hypothetical protein [Ectobacillus ponti]MCP8971314.1 hypothetical protein [Ectobacillus ponti]
MKYIIFILFIILLGYLGWRNLYGKERKRELVVFVSLLLYGAYVGVAGMGGFPYLNMITPFEMMLQPIGEGLELILGVKK